MARCGAVGYLGFCSVLFCAWQCVAVYCAGGDLVLDVVILDCGRPKDGCWGHVRRHKVERDPGPPLVEIDGERCLTA